MIVGIGVDIVEHKRIAHLFDCYGEKFARHILDDQEMSDYQKAPAPVRFLAKRFAAKEAAAKALGTGISQGITFNMIAIRHDGNGRPLLELMSKAADHASSIGVVTHWLSISDERYHSIAMVVLETGD
ncbi:MAG: holo-ACP synthase [Gammaproteobacteria bacterium]|nr:holo-ACP synthase [Gammaproteobacteria bacterium]